MLHNNTLRIFLVNDDMFCLNMYQQLLQNMGHTDIHLFSDGGQCLEEIASLPDIVLLYCSLELQEGIETLKYIKHHYPQIYVVILSENNNAEIIDSIFKLGAFDYIISGQDDAVKLQTLLTRIQQIQHILNSTPRLYNNKNNDTNNP